MDSVVVVLGEEVAFLGLLIRLANDWELLESESSATNLARWEGRAPDPLLGSLAGWRVAVVLNVEYADLLLPTPGGRVSGLDEGASLVERVRGVVLLTVAAGCVEVWSNFFFRSFTLCWAAPL